MAHYSSLEDLRAGNTFDRPLGAQLKELDDFNYGRRIAQTVVKYVAGVVLAIILIYFMLRVTGPWLNKYRAETERRAVIAEAEADADAAEHVARRQVEIATAEAEADRVRAEGIADANRTIAESLTQDYIRWYFVDKLDDVEGQIIYVPTEGGVPLTEAGRAVAAPAGGGG